MHEEYFEILTRGLCVFVVMVLEVVVIVVIVVVNDI